ncbi:unnamed protein product, partial [Prorocentrum cordatum]
RQLGPSPAGSARARATGAPRAALPPPAAPPRPSSAGRDGGAAAASPQPLRGHRGGTPTRLGAALAAALAPAAAPGAAAGGADGSEAADPGTEREFQAERAEGPPGDAPQLAAAAGAAATRYPAVEQEGETSIVDMVRALRAEIATAAATSQAEATTAEQAAASEREKESTATDVLRAMQGGHFGTAAVPLGGPAAGAEGAAPGPLRGMTAQPLAAAAGWAGSAAPRAAVETGPQINWTVFGIPSGGPVTEPVPPVQQTPQTDGQCKQQ